MTSSFCPLHKQFSWITLTIVRGAWTSPAIASFHLFTFQILVNKLWLPSLTAHQPLYVAEPLSASVHPSRANTYCIAFISLLLHSCADRSGVVPNQLAARHLQSWICPPKLQASQKSSNLETLSPKLGYFYFCFSLFSIVYQLSLGAARDVD